MNIGGIASMSLAVVSAAIAVSCGSDFGQVEQGRVIAYDQTNATVTVICDSNPGVNNRPRYDRLPPLVVRLPTDPRNMGRPPRAGYLLGIDREKSTVMTYDPDTGGIRALPAVNLEWKDGVHENESSLRRAMLPVVDRASSTVTTYLPRTRAVVKFSVPEQYASLPIEYWTSGDEVRYYYKSPGEAIKLMNVTRLAVY